MTTHLSHRLGKKLFCGKEEEGLTELRAAFEPDPDHMKMLVCMLHCAILAHESYRERGITYITKR